MRWPLLVSTLLLIPSIAEAGEDTDLAKQHFVLAEKLYQRGDYEGALQNLEKSYRHSGKPELLYNIARCEEQLGQLEKAVEHYRAFLKARPSGGPEIEARIQNLQRRLEQRSARSGPPRSIPRRSLRLPGWILVGVGGALVVTGAVLGWRASEQASDLEAASRQQPKAYFDDHESTQSAGRSLQTGAILGLAIGGAAAVAGTVLLILDGRRKGGERAAWLAPAVTAQGACLAGGLRF
jgi:tetratricopeptide (TPR) repeat protein